MAEARVVLEAGVMSVMLALCAHVGRAYADDVREQGNSPDARNGELVYYSGACAQCHGANLGGGGGPALKGTGFTARYPSEPAAIQKLYGFIKAQMPPQNPNLTALQAADVTAYVLERDGYAASAVSGALGDIVKEAKSEAGAPSTAESPRAPTSDRPTDQELVAARPEDWLMYNRDYGGQRFADLAQINSANAARLVAVCAFQTGETGSSQSSPLIFDGMLYATTATHTYAIDPTSCRRIWDAPNSADDALLLNNRGVALAHGRLFRSTPGGHLRALDAKTGSLLWDVAISDPSRGYWLGAAPVVFRGLVYMGEAGADFGNDGHVYAFDEVTGERRWSFDNIPSGRMPGADSWKIGGDHGGGSIWSTFSVDPGAALVYAPIGNPAPDFIGEARPGANLFTESVVAIESKTGKLAWYAQQVPHDIHDWDTAAAPTLFEQDGKSYMAVGNKEGYVYLYDRTHHKLVAKTEVTEHENVDDAITTAGVHVCPGWLGGVEWNGTAYSPADRMVYVNSVHWCGVYKKWASTPHYVPGEPYEGGDFIIDPQGTAYGWTRGIEIPSGKERWAVRATTPMVAAVTATAGGLVLTGELSGDFKALDSKTGRELYRFNTGGAIAGGISVFAVNGKEYIAVVSGNASKSTIWGTTGAPTIFVFSLPEAK